MTKQYRDRPFAQRFSEMGDTAEGVYDTVLPLGNSTKFGYRRPQGIKFSSLPETFRHMPDRCTALYLVEVCGLGRDGILKSMKLTKYEALKKWNKWAKEGGLLGVVLFVWNSAEREFLIVQWQEVVEEVAYSKKKYGIQVFESDGNEYYRLDYDRLRSKAAAVGSHDEDD